MIFDLLNLIHVLLVFSPISLLFVNPIYINKWFKYYVLIMLLVPLHWIFFDNKCIFTEISKYFGNYSNTETENSQFTENYLKWLYNPIMKMINLDWNEKNINKASNFHWILNFLIIWYYIFYIFK